MTYYKAVMMDGTSFFDGKTPWKVGEVTTLRPSDHDLPYLSVSVVPTDCTGMQWPCRLFEVEPVEGHEVITPQPMEMPNKRGATAWRVVRELNPVIALGPNGEEVLSILDRAQSLTKGDDEALSNSWMSPYLNFYYETDFIDAWDIVLKHNRGAALDSLSWIMRELRLGTRFYGLTKAVRGAVIFTLIKDLISKNEYDRMMTPWWSVVGKEN